MPQPRNRVHDPEAGKYCEVRQRTVKGGRMGQIKGLWKNQDRAF